MRLPLEREEVLERLKVNPDAPLIERDGARVDQANDLIERAPGGAVAVLGHQRELIAEGELKLLREARAEDRFIGRPRAQPAPPLAELLRELAELIFFAREHTADQRAARLIFAPREREGQEARCNQRRRWVSAERIEALWGGGEGLMELTLTRIIRVMELKMGEGVGDHLIEEGCLDTTLERDRAHREREREAHRGRREERATRSTPEVPPAELEEHRRISLTSGGTVGRMRSVG